MDAKKARQLSHPMYQHIHSDELLCAPCEAKGYLAALERPEILAERRHAEEFETKVAKLVEAGEQMADWIANDGMGQIAEDSGHTAWLKALSSLPRPKAPKGTEVSQQEISDTETQESITIRPKDKGEGK